SSTAASDADPPRGGSAPNLPRFLRLRRRPASKLLGPNDRQRRAAAPQRRHWHGSAVAPRSPKAPVRGRGHAPPGDSSPPAPIPAEGWEGGWEPGMTTHPARRRSGNAQVPSASSGARRQQMLRTPRRDTTPELSLATV